MIDKKLRESLDEYGKENEYEIVFFENPSFDRSIVGISTDGKLVYDYVAMVQEYSEENECSYEDAMEFISYNTIRSLPYYKNKPIIINEVTIDEILMNYSM